jgi:predicted PurR-regulated permease PerM
MRDSREDMGPGGRGGMAMRGGFANLVYGTAFAIMLGWVLHVGRGIILPIVAAIIVVYVVIGLAGILQRIPRIGPQIPSWVRHLISVLVIGFALSSMVSLLITNVGAVASLAPQYQESLLGLIQRVAAFLDLETEPTWETLRRDVLGQISFQSMIGPTVASISAIVGTFFIVLLYAGFLLLEKGAFEQKFNRLSDDPGQVALIRKLIADINQRIGAYLALKTFINVILGLLSYAIMRFLGIEFAGFWAVLIALFNYIPYLGSFLGVVFPVALSALQFGDLNVVLLVLVALTAAQIFVGSFLEPYLMGNQLNLSPFVIMVSLTVWAALWGIAGALLSVPITAIMVIVFSEFPGTRPLAILLSRDGRVGPEPPH